MSKNITKIDFNKLCLQLDEIVEANMYRMEALSLINMTNEYYDCETSLINSLTDETIEMALDIISNEDDVDLNSLASTSNFFSNIDGIRNRKEATSSDLF